MKADERGDGYLMSAFLAGDQDAFSLLYDRYDRQCFHFIRRVLGPAHRESAEDVHQDTWLAAAASGSNYHQERGAFGTWLLTIARNKVLDHLRKQKVAFIGHAEVDGGDEFERALEEVRDDAPSPIDRLESRQLARALVHAVDSLPLSQREVFVMFAVGGMSLDEIAESTKAGLETVKSRLRYARAALKVALDQWRPVDA